MKMVVFRRRWLMVAGCAAAAIAITRPGAAPAIPARDEVESLLK